MAKRRASRSTWPGNLPGHATGTLQDRPAALYCRVSKNPDATGQEQKSVRDQETDGRAWAADAGVRLLKVYADDDRGASEFSGKTRDEFDEMRADVRAGRYAGGVIWFWATSRQTRGDVSLDELKRECAEAGVLWCFHGQPVNPANHRDMTIRLFSGIMDAQYAADLSDAVMRGKGSSAKAADGYVKPPGRVPYGYVRQWDQTWTGKGRRWLRDVPDDSTTDRETGARRPKEASPACIVREIITRTAAGESQASIAIDLRRRRIPTPTPQRRGATPRWWWNHNTVRYIALNPVYIGKRVYQVEQHSPNRADRMGAILPDEYDEARMPHLIDRATFWRAYRNLTGVTLPEGHRLEGRPRKTTRNGPRSESSMLAAVATCAGCGALVIKKRYAAHIGYDWSYQCGGAHCSSIPLPVLDEYVIKVLSGVLGDAGVARELTSITGDTGTTDKARGDLEEAKAELERMWRQVDAGEIDPAIATRTKRRLDQKIADAEQLLNSAELPAGLTPEMIGQRAETELRRMYAAGEWIKLRQIIRTVADIRIHPLGRGLQRVPAIFRVSFRPLMPAPGDWIMPADYEPIRAEAREHRAERKAQGYVSAELRERIATALRAAPEKANKPLMRELGSNYARAVQIVREELERAGEIPVIRHKGRSGPVNHGYLVHRLQMGDARPAGAVVPPASEYVTG